MFDICEACEQESEVIIIDNGIGHYEYWGAKGFDSQPEAVSKCCEAPVNVSVRDIEEEAEDARADYEIEMAKERRLFPDEYDW